MKETRNKRYATPPIENPSSRHKRKASGVKTLDSEISNAWGSREAQQLDEPIEEVAITNTASSGQSRSSTSTYLLKPHKRQRQGRHNSKKGAKSPTSGILRLIGTPEIELEETEGQGILSNTKDLHPGFEAQRSQSVPAIPQPEKREEHQDNSNPPPSQQQSSAANSIMETRLPKEGLSAELKDDIDGLVRAQAAMVDQIKQSLSLHGDLNPATNKRPPRSKVVFGAREEVGLSRIGRADKEIRQLEQLIEEHLEFAPEAVPVLEKSCQEAREIRAKLEDNEENNRVGVKNPGKIVIADRIKILESTLETSRFGPERENIQAAIKGYKSGNIAFWDKYTIIYAGKIVDTAPDYRSFTRDRSERLDRYQEAHGDHWLWWEAPLDIHPEERIMAKRSLCLPQARAHHALGAYYIEQSFQKRDGWVTRMKQTALISLPKNYDTFIHKEKTGEVWAGEASPKMIFRSMLDSGATFPTLYARDLAKCGIHPDFYACQSVSNMVGANGQWNSKVYEMVVTVVDEGGNELVDSNDPMWPVSDHYLGGLCPVAEAISQQEYDMGGKEENNRLSGMLPFLACYISSTPNNESLFLGEDRRDVLGHQRMPGQKRWNINYQEHSRAYAPGNLSEGRTTFTHNNGGWIDEDHPEISRASRITIGKGTFNQMIVDINPDNHTKGILAEREREKQLKRLREIQEEIQEKRQADATQRGQ